MPAPERGHSVVADVLPSWLEVTTDDYYPRDVRRQPGNRYMSAAWDRLDELLAQQRAGAFRLRIVLRETHDLKPGLGRNPLSVNDYEYGPDIALDAKEVVLVTHNGQRQRVRG
jgi:hypothetical protein